MLIKSLHRRMIDVLLSDFEVDLRCSECGEKIEDIEKAICYYCDDLHCGDCPVHCCSRCGFMAGELYEYIDDDGEHYMLCEYCMQEIEE